jgi:exopolyphosphatase / guanosine-5'-triphosphate,3'-diphosphate pyrophosphatase
MDRADVIVPASKIYLGAMTAAKSKRMIVPDVGLKDGVMNLLYERNK